MNPNSQPRQWRDRILQQEDLNFLLTNRVPRIALTRFMGWFSQIRQPLVRDLSLRVWRFFGDLDLSEARKSRFDSLHDCFIRELKPGARPVVADPQVLCSPCDAILGANGTVQGLTVFQAKGFPYTLPELFGPRPGAFEPYRDGVFATLRLTSAMYHRFHAPHDCTVHHVTHHSGDTWNVNPIALKRVRKLFCRNERAVLHTVVGAAGHPVALVPVAAILVASLRLHWLDAPLGLDWQGPAELPCDARFSKGDEMGWFQHGSTIIVFAPHGFRLAEGLATGSRLRVGEALMRLPATAG
jgi:phosphatidylserine decarboxylase